MEETQTDTKAKPRLIFLLGAGASVDAGVPDTYSFVKEFENYIRKIHPELEAPLNQIIETREQFNEEKTGKKEVDVEQLLDTLRRLIDRENDPLLFFYKSNEFSLNGLHNEFDTLERYLQNYIRKRVIIEDEDKLDYLKEFFNFERPLEIYSTNYDTCIEQLCYTYHRLYTDGFDITWNENNFDDFHDIKHFKLHGSVIWYQNLRTKECIKIPVNSFREDEPLDLSLIYGESVKPLIIYPAQKAEYIEPLTDLQLKFKHRLFNNTKFVVAVGFSFRDNYITHMLWDAARANDNLFLILINPNAQDIFEEKLRYTDVYKKSESRLRDRTICLPYPFTPIISQLRNNYLRTIDYICQVEKECFQEESRGDTNVRWLYLLTLCIDGEFIAKAEDVLQQRIKKNWLEIEFSQPPDSLKYAFKAFVHSAICKDEFLDSWTDRLNEKLRLFNSSNLELESTGFPAQFMFSDGKFTYPIKKVLDDWVKPLSNEYKRVITLLTPRFESKLSNYKRSFERLQQLEEHLTMLQKGVDWRFYKEDKDDSEGVLTAKRRLNPSSYSQSFRSGEIQQLILVVEKDRLQRVFNGDSLVFVKELVLN